MKSLNLPKGYLSASAINLWRKSKKQFRKRYYENEKLYVTKYMTWGKNFGEAVETGDYSKIDMDTSQVIQDLPTCEKYEDKFEVEINGVPVLGFFDGFDQDEYTEYKTSKNHQTPADHDIQLSTYWIAFNLKYGYEPTHCNFYWIETIEDERGNLTCSGRVEYYEWRPKPNHLETFKSEIRDIAEEISEDYTAWQSGSLAKLDSELIANYTHVAKTLKQYEVKVKEVKEKLKEELVTKGLTDYQDDKINIFYTTRKSYKVDAETDKKIKALKAEIKKLQLTGEETETKSLTIKVA